MSGRNPVMFTFLVILIALAPVGAQDKADPGDEALKIARVAMETKLKIGDALRAKGDLEGALKAYREAEALYQKAIEAYRARRAGKVPREVIEEEPVEQEVVEDEPDIPEEEIVEEPIETAEAREAARRRERRGVGAAAKTEKSLARALQWLAAHQDEDGRWDCDDFMKHDPWDDKCDGSGGALYDVGVTGLSLLALLGAGYTDRGTAEQNPYARNVRTGLRYLMSVQTRDGVFGPRVTHSFIYNHAMATLALCEAYWLTRNPRYKRPAQEGVNFLLLARNPYLAWRYGPRSGENDTSVTAWCVLALKSAQHAGLSVDPDAFAGARAWIEKMTDPQFGQVGYNYPGGSVARAEGRQDKFPPEKSQAMTAAGILTRIMCGEDPRRSEMIRKGAALCLKHPPLWNPEDGSIDMYYWYFGGLAMYQVGGQHWRRWNEAMKLAIVQSQHPNGAGARTGSWDPIGAWGPDCGRVVSTALMALCLEVYYRYDRVFGVKPVR